MRKGWLAIAAVAIAGMGYLGAQAYSSHVFERELERNLEALRADGEWHVERTAVERGWFHSRGRLSVAPAGSDPWQVTLPYDARHGLLSTRISGALRVRLPASSNAASRALFGEVLASAEPRWTATLHTLDRRGEGRIDVAGFELRRGERQLTSGGAHFLVEGRAGDVRVDGEIAPLQLVGPQGEILTEPLRLDSRFQTSGNGRFLHQRNTLQLERLEYRGGQRPPLTLSGLRYRDETRLDEDLTLDASLSLERAEVSGQTLLSGNLALGLERIDGESLRRLVAQVTAAAEAHGGDLSGLDGAQRRALVQRLQPTLLAMLSDSPRLTLEGVKVVSPMFGVDMRGHGELVFDGEDVTALSIAALDDPAGRQAWRQHLDGTLRFYGVPPLLAMQLGLPLDSETLEVTIEAGEVRVNGRSLPALDPR